VPAFISAVAALGDGLDPCGLYLLPTLMNASRSVSELQNAFTPTTDMFAGRMLWNADVHFAPQTGIFGMSAFDQTDITASSA
jgi:hypothetical protein